MFKFIWRIENFCLLPQRTGEYIDSPVFEIKTLGSLKAFIRLFPQGKGSNTCISFHLHPADLSQKFESGTNIKISIADKSHSESKETFANLSGEFELVWFERKAFKMTDFNSGLFMGANSLNIECIIYNSCAGTTVASCLKTVVQMEFHKHDLSLHTFFPTASLKEEFEHSKQFSIEQHSDSFQFSVEKRLIKNALRIRRICRMESEVSVFLKVLLLGDAVYTESMCERHLFEADPETEFWEVPFAVDENAMEMFTTLRCEIIIPKGSILTVFENCLLPSRIITLTRPDESKRNYKSFPLTLKSKTICNSLLRSMYKTKNFSDVILRVGNDQFPVHKCVLASISVFFAAMFRNKMKEAESNIADLQDIEKDILAKMLQFVYTGEVENLSSEDLIKLYSIAEAYGIRELKKLCSLHFSSKLSPDNVVEMLRLADAYQDPALEKAALNFIGGNRNEIFISGMWKDFMKNHREIANDIMQHICKES